VHLLIHFIVKYFFVIFVMKGNLLLLYCNSKSFYVIVSIEGRILHKLQVFMVLCTSTNQKAYMVNYWIVNEVDVDPVIISIHHKPFATTAVQKCLLLIIEFLSVDTNGFQQLNSKYSKSTDRITILLSFKHFCNSIHMFFSTLYWLNERVT